MQIIVQTKSPAIEGLNFGKNFFGENNSRVFKIFDFFDPPIEVDVNEV